MNTVEKAEKLGIVMADASYMTDMSESLMVKVKAFMDKFYPKYSGSIIECKDSSGFHDLFVHIRLRDDMTDWELSEVGRFYSRMAHEMFTLGAEILWQRYERTKSFVLEEEDALYLSAVKAWDFDDTRYKVDSISSIKDDEAFEEIYSILKMEPYSVPEDEDELVDYAKIWFDAGTSVMWKYILEYDSDKDESEKGRFGILDFLSDILLFFI